MNRIVYTLQASVLAALLSIALGAILSPSHAQASAHPTYLSDATRSPRTLVLLPPRAHVTYAHGRAGWQCRRGPQGYYYSEVQAYTWHGGALQVQRWSADRTLTYWRLPRAYGRGRVTFDGVTFRNHSTRPALVAGWCES